MLKGLTSIIATSLLTLNSQVKAESNDTIIYNFRAAPNIPILSLVALLTGEIKYYKNFNEIYGEIIPQGGIAKIFGKNIEHRTYSTVFYRDSIVYIQRGDSLADSLKAIKKSLKKDSPYFDVLTSVSVLLDYIDRDSLEHHPLVKEGFLNLFVDNKVISAKLTSLDKEKIKYKGRELIVTKLCIENCPDDKTFFEIYIHNKEIIKVYCHIKRGCGINLNAEIVK